MKKLFKTRLLTVFRFVLLISVCLLIVAGINSCKKELTSKQSTEKANGAPTQSIFAQPKAQNISFKDFLDATKKITSSALNTLLINSQRSNGLLKINDTNSADSLVLFIDSIKLMQKSGHQTYTIPVKQKRFYDVAFRNLILDVYNGELTVFLITYTPDNTYLTNYIHGIRGRFTGKAKLELYDIDHNSAGLQIQSDKKKTNTVEICQYVTLYLGSDIHMCSCNEHWPWQINQCTCPDVQPGGTYPWMVDYYTTVNICYEVDLWGDGGGGPGPSGPGDGGGGAGSPPTPPPGYDPCPPVNVASSGLKVQYAEGEPPCIPPVVTDNGETSRRNALSSILTQVDDYLFDCDSVQLLQIAAYQAYGDMYKQVAKFTPSPAVKNRIDSLNNLIVPGDLNSFGLQNLSKAFGTVVNCDFFPVKITTLPTGMTMASLTEYFRLHMTDFTSSLATFSPYVGPYLNDESKFNQTGASSVGALVHIGMFNDGTIVESDYQNNVNGVYYKYTTIKSPLDYNHPVAGNREFGIYPDPSNPGTYVFYTMGVDRISDWEFAFGNALSLGKAFRDADKLWNAMQTNMINYINNHGGQAGNFNKKSYIARPDWSVVKEYLDGTITLQQLKQKIGC